LKTTALNCNTLLTKPLLLDTFSKNYANVESTLCLTKTISPSVALSIRTGTLSTAPLLTLPALYVHSTSRKLSGTRDLLREKASLEIKLSYAFVKTPNKTVNLKKIWSLTGVTSPGGETKSLSLMDAKILTKPANVDSLMVNSLMPS
jgi:hypothetical protein